MKSSCANVERTLSCDADGSIQLGCTPLEHSQCSTGPPWTRTGPTSCANEERTKLFDPGVHQMYQLLTQLAGYGYGCTRAVTPERPPEDG